MDELERQPEKNLSRRSMLKRIGAGAAIAWTAPVLTSLRVPAFAQVISGGCGDCADPCGGNPECNCWDSTSGPFCGNNFACGQTEACATDLDCPPGWGCQQPSCQGNCGTVCVPPCGTSAGAGGSGPTNA